MPIDAHPRGIGQTKPNQLINAPHHVGQRRVPSLHAPGSLAEVGRSCAVGPCMRRPSIGLEYQVARRRPSLVARHGAHPVRAPAHGVDIDDQRIAPAGLVIRWIEHHTLQCRSGGRPVGNGLRAAKQHGRGLAIRCQPNQPGRLRGRIVQTPDVGSQGILHPHHHTRCGLRPSPHVGLRRQQQRRCVCPTEPLKPYALAVRAGQQQAVPIPRPFVLPNPLVQGVSARSLLTQGHDHDVGFRGRAALHVSDHPAIRRPARPVLHGATGCDRCLKAAGQVLQPYLSGRGRQQVVSFGDRREGDGTAIGRPTRVEKTAGARVQHLDSAGTRVHREQSADQSLAWHGRSIPPLPAVRRFGNAAGRAGGAQEDASERQIRRGVSVQNQRLAWLGRVRWQADPRCQNDAGSIWRPCIVEGLDHVASDPGRRVRVHAARKAGELPGLRLACFPAPELHAAGAHRVERQLVSCRRPAG
ncbi:hypothetical protein ANT2_4571 [plant metagenome]|uniref:Uncharacterized protein n=1 Tax=plant metagenome TaxID=1297885 RepID=A0A484S5L7_9ZZZZ